MQTHATQQTLAGFIYEHLDEIERLIEMGVYQQSICEQLGYSGRTMSVGTFRRSLARARDKRDRTQADPSNPGLQRSRTKLRLYLPVTNGRRFTDDELDSIVRSVASPTVDLDSLKFQRPPLLPSSAKADGLPISKLVYDCLDEIEYRISVGIRQEALCEELARSGYSISLTTFKKALSRARKKKKQNQLDVATKENPASVVNGQRMSPFELMALEQLQKSQSPLATSTLGGLQLSPDEHGELSHLVETFLARRIQAATTRHVV
jgi:hypothetical protein